MILRRLLRPGPRLTRDEAVERAKAACRERGASTDDPILVKEHRHVFVIHPKGDYAPGGPWIRIDAHNGEVLKYEHGTR